MMMWWLSEIEVIENHNFLTPLRSFLISIQIRSKNIQETGDVRDKIGI